jgi:hypothetical protein
MTLKISARRSVRAALPCAGAGGLF